MALSRRCAKDGAVDKVKQQLGLPEKNAKSDGAPEMIIVAQRKLIRQPRLGSGLSLGLCASFIAAWSRLARTWPWLLRRAYISAPGPGGDRP